MKEFKEDDDGYRRWIESHPNGYVLNAERGTLSTALMRLHQSSCHTIAPKPGIRWTWLYIKVCSTSIDEIVDYVRTKYGVEPKVCGTCDP